MPLPTLKELKSESERLKQMLGWIMDENAGLKYRLSEVLKEKFDDKMLIKVEDYQSYFIQEDELIGLLRNDIALLDKKMLAIAIDDKKSIKLIEKKLQLLCNNIATVQNKFSQLKVAFTNYLASNSLFWKTVI